LQQEAVGSPDGTLASCEALYGGTVRKWTTESTTGRLALETFPYNTRTFLFLSNLPGWLVG